MGRADDLDRAVKLLDAVVSRGAQRDPDRSAAAYGDGAHPVNAMLNYAYAVLESEIRIKAISEGYDPTIGIMHATGFHLISTAWERFLGSKGFG